MGDGLRMSEEIMPAGEISLRCTHSCASWVGTATKTHVNIQTGRRLYSLSHRWLILFIAAVAVTLPCKYLIRDLDGVLPMRDANIREGELFVFVCVFVFIFFVLIRTFATVTWLLVVIVFLNFRGTQVTGMHRPGYRENWTLEIRISLFQVEIQPIVRVYDVVYCYFIIIFSLKSAVSAKNEPPGP